MNGILSSLLEDMISINFLWGKKNLKRSTDFKHVQIKMPKSIFMQRKDVFTDDHFEPKYTYIK